jgi:hypothetical protein
MALPLDDVRYVNSASCARVRICAPTALSATAPSQLYSPLSNPLLLQAYLIEALGCSESLNSLPASYHDRLADLFPTSSVSEAAANQQVAKRDGAVLGSGRILKADQFPYLRDQETAAPGAPQFRQVPGEPVYGTAQPTVQGIMNVLDRVGAGPGGTGPAALWTNLREEPVVYINGRPYNPRKLQDPMENLEQPGTSPVDVEQSDDRLKADIMREAAANVDADGRHYVVIHDEDENGRLVARKEYIDMDPSHPSVSTPRDVFTQLQSKGYRVDYARIPIADEKAPEPQDFDALVKRLREADPQAPLIFNCHAGRGRTTTGEVVADIVRRARNGQMAPDLSQSAAMQRDVQEQGEGDPDNYRCLQRLLQSLQQGRLSQQDLDSSIERAGAVTNLRTAIGHQLLQAQSQPDPARREADLARLQDYVKRYFYLVAFDEYAREEAANGFSVPFSQWASEHHLSDTLDNLQAAVGLPASDTCTAA